MADPRFYDNRGPFRLVQICEASGVRVSVEAPADAWIFDVADLEGAARQHLTFFTGNSNTAELLAQTQAGFCFVGENGAHAPPPGCIAVRCPSVPHAFSAAASLFYPQSGLAEWRQEEQFHPSAKLDEGVVLGPHVVVGPGAEIGRGTRIGPNTVIARGVAIGRDCEIGSNTSISHALIGDGVLILSGAQIGGPGFGFASSAAGHLKIPQLGRVIVQDRVEIGSCTAVDRGALGDTVIGEGSKIDNVVQIGHNTRIGRHCVIVGHVGISGSCQLGDFVIVGGQAGIADHAKIGEGARLAARTGVVPGELPGGRDYGGMPAKPLREYARELAALKLLARGKKKA